MLSRAFTRGERKKGKRDFGAEASDHFGIASRRNRLFIKVISDSMNLCVICID